ncbi:MAG: TonB C-terminal domain-containing protein [Kiritimatiellae bacterium]|nr:TonB C-terminal domain-containing protein [Kiritimatiellia bacterium]
MEIWRPENPDEREPKVLSAANLCIAVALHVALFAGFWVFAVFHGLFDKEEEIIPIDLTVVVVENLDGKEDEPPPLKKPEPPPPPKPKPKPKPEPKKPDPPKELEKIVTNVVAKVDKKKDEPKKTEKKEDPKKTKEELREERMKRMRESAKVVNKTTVVKEPTKPQPNGRTDRKILTDAEIAKLLNQGYKPGRSTNLASNAEQLAYSLIKEAFGRKWDKPPWTDTLKPMTIRVWFGGGGRIVGHKIERSSGDIRADQSIKAAAERVGAIPALAPEFIEKYRKSGVPVQFTVKPH